MTTTNDITGDKLKTKANSRKYLDNFDRIFNPDKKPCKKCKAENSSSQAQP